MVGHGGFAARVVVELCYLRVDFAHDATGFDGDGARDARRSLSLPTAWQTLQHLFLVPAMMTPVSPGGSFLMSIIRWDADTEDSPLLVVVTR